MTPASIRSSYAPDSALKPMAPFSFLTCSATTEPSKPALLAICRMGSSRARLMILTPRSSSWLFSFRSTRAGSAAQEGHAAAGHDAFFHRGAGGVEGVFHPGLLLFHFHFRGRADADDRDAAHQFGQPLLEFFPVVVRGGLIDLDPDLLHPAFNGRPVAAAVDDGGVVPVDGSLSGRCPVLSP